jgi:hypothetical protein
MSGPQEHADIAVRLGRGADLPGRRPYSKESQEVLMNRGSSGVWHELCGSLDHLDITLSCDTGATQERVHFISPCSSLADGMG